MGLLPKNSSLKFKPIPHGFSTESLCFDFVLFFFMRNDTNPHVGNSSDTIVPHSLLHSEDMFLLARKTEIVIQQNLLLIIRAPTSARPSSELIGQFTIYRIGFQNSALVRFTVSGTSGVKRCTSRLNQPFLGRVLNSLYTSVRPQETVPPSKRQTIPVFTKFLHIRPSILSYRKRQV